MGSYIPCVATITSVTAPQFATEDVFDPGQDNSWGNKLCRLTLIDFFWHGIHCCSTTYKPVLLPLSFSPYTSLPNHFSTHGKIHPCLWEEGGRGLSLLWPPNTSIHAIIFNRFKTDIPHKNFMGSTIRVLFYLIAFSSLKAFFRWDPTCSRNTIPLKIHTSISWQGFPYFFNCSQISVLSPHISFLYQTHSIVGFELKTDFARMVLTFTLHKGNKVAKSHGRFLEGKPDSKYTQLSL